MRFQNLSFSFFLLSLSISAAHSYKLTYFKGENCEGEKLPEVDIGPSLGCKSDQAKEAKSVMVKSTGPIDKGWTLVMFKTDNCDPDQESMHGDDGEEGSACYTGEIAAVEAWDLYSDA
ncbi:hypothetical protein CC78DRAFT_611744 [Lojkania enalia]|uniref:Uncharacterized protein n=1 Tax=Lojkania enalia TaxID=147567 RepID=A0A9P4NBB2_9PLEO|nr:hypothetical protein CC78DRAFT_611744 [Didymosphaeria enalia]